MDVFDQTQALDVLNASEVNDTDDDDDDYDNGNDKRVVGNLKILSQRGFPETDYPVYMGENIIGRSIAECQIHVPIKVLSKRHAVIEVDKDVHMVYDCESHNKSYKGNLQLRPMVRYEIRDGEKLKFGDVKCEYSKSCLISIDDEDSQSDTATESILMGPKTSNENDTRKKVLAESVEKDVKTFVAPDVSFVLKSDSESSDNEDCIIPSSQPDKTFVPETPAANLTKISDKKRLSLANSSKKPIVVLDSDSDTDIDVEKSAATVDVSISKDDTIKVDCDDVDSNSDFEEAANSLIDIIEAPTQKYPTDSEYLEKKNQQSKASTSKEGDGRSGRKTDTEIDWSNLETQPYILSAADVSDEEAADSLIDSTEAPTEAYPSDSEYFEKKKQQSKASTSKEGGGRSGRKTDTEIDWSNLETQPYIVSAADVSDEEIMNMETQVYPVQESDSKEYNTSEEDVAFAETIPVSEVEIIRVKESKIIKPNEDESEPFASQCSDNEIRVVQNKVVDVLQSAALALSPQSPVAQRRAHLAAETSALSSAATIEVLSNDNHVPGSSPKIPKSRSKLSLSSEVESSLVTELDKTEDQNKTPSKGRGRKKSAKESPAVVSAAENVEVEGRSRKGGRGKRKSDEKNVEENDNSRAKKVRAGTSKDRATALLPEPVVPNPALPSSPKTYSRKERSTESSKLESQSISANDEETEIVQSVEKSSLDDRDVVAEVICSTKTKGQKLNSNRVLETIKIVSDDKKSNDLSEGILEDQSPRVEPTSASSRARRKKPVLIIADGSDNETLEVALSSERNLKVVSPPVKIPSTSITPFRRVGRLPDAKLADGDDDDDDDDVFDDMHRSPSTRNAKRLKESNEMTLNTEIQSPVRSTRRRQKTNNETVSTPRLNVASVKEQNKVPVVEKETPKRSRGRPSKRSLSSEKSPMAEVKDRPVALTRSPSKRGLKKDEPKEETPSKVKEIKGSKKQKVTYEGVESGSSHDVSVDEEGNVSKEESEVKSSGTPSKRGRKKAEPKEETLSKVKVIKGSKKQKGTNEVVESESLRDVSDDEEGNLSKEESEVESSRTPSKRGRKKAEPKEETLSKVKVIKGSKKQKGTNEVVESESLRDVSDDEEGNVSKEESEVESSRTPSKRGRKKAEPKEESFSKVKVIKGSKKQKGTNEVVESESLRDVSDDEEGNVSKEESEVESSRTPSKRGRKKAEPKEETPSKVKVIKGSKKQKVTNEVVESASLRDVSDDEEGNVPKEESEVKSSRSVARNRTPKTKSSANVTSTPETNGPASKKRRGRTPNSSLSEDRSPKSPRLQLNQPKVMFTGFSDAIGEKTVKKLGGSLTDSVFDATHLVTDKVRRTCKLLCMVARGLPVVSVEWLRNCADSKRFVDASPFLIKDKASENQLGYSLSKSLNQASKKKLLEGYGVHVTKSVKPDPEQMQPIVECAGGQFLSKMPKKASDGNMLKNIVISCVEDGKLCLSAKKTDIPIVGAEFILTGILRQEVDIKSNLLCDGETSSQEINKRGTPRKNKVTETKASPAKSISSLKVNGVGRKKFIESDDDFVNDDDDDDEVVINKKSKKETKSTNGGGQTLSRGRSKAVEETPSKRTVTRSTLSRRKGK